MSDTQQDAQNDLGQAGLEDSLGSALGSSFSFPAPTRPAPSAPKPATEAESTSAPPSEPIEGLDAWPGVYDSYVKSWTEEHLEARAKAEAVKEQYEAEKRKARQEEDDKLKAAEKAQRALKAQQENAKRLQRELRGEEKEEETGEGSRGRTGAAARGVKEAWEMVKGDEDDGAGEEEETASAADGRGVLPQDVEGGQAVVTGEGRKPVKQPMYNPITSTEPMPPSMQSTSTTPAAPTHSPLNPLAGSVSQSVHSATSEAWQDVSRLSASASSSSAEDLSPARTRSVQSGSGPTDELVDVPAASSRVGRDLTGPAPSQITPGGLSQPDASSLARAGQPSSTSLTAPSAAGPDPSPASRTPPAQPPSLTLSLFTMPSHLSVTRVLAVLGINLVLPFVNGVMLGFGEIFAREAVRVGKLVWRGERASFGSSASGPNRGVGSVGLSGGRGF